MTPRPWAAVVGDPVNHSLSPGIFSTFSRELGRPLRYRALRLPAARLPEALLSARSKPWVGWNVTLPLKVAILPRLSSLDDSARAAGAVNVVRFEGDACIGYNTDSAGFLAPLERRGFSVQHKRALVLGSGGAARAVCSALQRGGARAVVLNRTAEKAARLAGEFGFEGGGLERVGSELEKADLVVNATSAGMDGTGSPLPRGTRFKRGTLAYDLVYLPPRTPFLLAAARDGAQTIGGLPMLVAQAAATWRIWFGEDVPRTLIAQIETGLGRYLGWEP